MFRLDGSIEGHIEAWPETVHLLGDKGFKLMEIGGSPEAILRGKLGFQIIIHFT